MSDEIPDLPAEEQDEFDASAAPLWQSIVALGQSVPAEEWDRVPTDLSTNLGHYLYDKPRYEDDRQDETKARRPARPFR
jgi:hypothetical protein